MSKVLLVAEANVTFVKGVRELWAGMLKGPLPQIEGGRTELAGDADDDCGSVLVMKKVVDDLRGLEGIFVLFFATLSVTAIFPLDYNMHNLPGEPLGRSRDCWGVPGQSVDESSFV